MGCGLGFILFENICLCSAFVDFCLQESTTISNDQSVHGHGGCVWLRVHCKPHYTFAALHRVKKKRAHWQHLQKTIRDLRSRLELKLFPLWLSVLHPWS